MFRPFIRKILPAPVRRWVRQFRSVSKHYEIIDPSTATQVPSGWTDPQVAQRQHQSFVPLLEQMHDGRVRPDFAALASSFKATGLDDPLVVEVGCGSGWNSEVLSCLLGKPMRYVGLDVSPAMVALGKRSYPAVPFVVGDAVRLPLRDRACDILVSGTVLMHLLGYREALQEGRRVTRRWCILHTVPVVRGRPTTLLRKLAYGSAVVEIVFNAQELEQLLQQARLTVREIIPSLPHDYLRRVLKEPVTALTYVCEVIADEEIRA